MKDWLIADTHFDHDNIGTYCFRPKGWQEKLVKQWNLHVSPEDRVFHLGDVLVGRPQMMGEIMASLNGHKILIMGNHDTKSPTWYMRNGFDVACTSMIYRGLLLTHKPALSIPKNVTYNIHGHLHNNQIGKGYGYLTAQHRLFCLEWIGYKPVTIDNAFAKGTFPTKALRDGTHGDKRVVFAPRRQGKRTHYDNA